MDAAFYALVADLAGAPQELIDPDDGSVAGWVYNRFRFYDPWSGVNGSQDPFGGGAESSDTVWVCG